MSARIDGNAVGVVFAVVGMAVCIVVFIGLHLLRVYGPVIREAILATVTPQFAAGMLFMALLLALGALVIAWAEPA